VAGVGMILPRLEKRLEVVELSLLKTIRKKKIEKRGQAYIRNDVSATAANFSEEVQGKGKGWALGTI